ncbi:hypothetical protein [Inconstantimicrobium mannanitabidum]|uniref:Uncharacterized protein n=1 Tax=Inconstantimicrobium mannanitabidum TaxID=1604901 RepID=A0ACB5R9Y8_9CLOT|nr:hypothetical protein [Clostridium sp. TW13]GKX65855.1 hypothetical protein rsdtw13_11130 [Clostridium sp. TW13]
MNGGETLRYIRTTLGLKQKDIRDEGLRDISGIENGVVQMSSKIAIALEKKLNEVIKEKHLDGILDFEVNSLVFKKGLDIDFEECFKQMSRDYKIDRFLELTQDQYEFSNVKRAIEILKRDYEKNLNSISRLAYKIIQSSNDDNCIIYAYTQLITISCYKQDYKNAVTIFDIIKDNVSCCSDTEMRDDIYVNISIACCHIGDYITAEKLINDVKYTTRYREYVDNILFLINSNLNRLDKALEYCYKMLSYTINDDTSLTNKFNICYVASLKGDIDLFKKYFNLIDADRHYSLYTREQFLKCIIESCATFNISDIDILSKIFKIGKRLDSECISENIEYFKSNCNLIYKIILNRDINIDSSVYVFICKNSDMNFKEKEKLITLCDDI